MERDLTTRARIRDAAIAAFGANGFTRTTVRTVPAAAGVSPGLVIHHFGSKDGLRATCDEHVLYNSSSRAIDTTDAERMRAGLLEYLGHPERYVPEVAYIRQSVVDESDVEDAFFDALVDQTVMILEEGMAKGGVRALEDVRGVAVLPATNSMGVLVLGRHIARSLGTGDDVMDMVRRIGVPAAVRVHQPAVHGQRHAGRHPGRL
ncbi:TetR/AcrR family transcriptional regulator [Specibacter cremeus]|uniref:TetR/AcrR family transcriptional regulator n=1 Tax=Specibacter cremeus TaxID=1629051 RepID=UPI001F0BD352|nr:TetR family transcriptional regulator [Specibacter cremeus]